MKHLFLDIDGVLNNKNSMNTFGHIAGFHSEIYAGNPLSREKMNFDVQCFYLIASLIREFNLKVVISSTWRMGVESKHFQELFKLYNLDLPLDRIDLIEQKEETKDCDRSQMIMSYINKNNVEEFICVDDTTTHFSILRDRLVLTSMETGFTLSHYYKSVELFS